MPGKRSLFRILAGLTLLMTSCYSDYLCLSYDVYHGARWNSRYTQVVFVASTKAYRRAKGITAFPDGGIPETLVDEAGLYIFDTASLQLSRLVSFTDLAALMRNRWMADIAFTDSALHYRIDPASDWELYLGWADTKEDSAQIYRLREKYSKPYVIALPGGHVSETDTSVFLAAYGHNRDNEKAGPTPLNKILPEIPVSCWGLELREIYPKSEREYIEDLIFVAKEGSVLTKRAIIEQIISPMSEQGIREILDRMNEYKNSLGGVEKMEYELYSKETYARIRDLLPGG